MTYPDPHPSRRDRLQARLEEAVGRGEITISEYEDACARVWSVDYGDDSTELDAVAGKLQRLEEAREHRRSAGGAPSANPHHGSGVARTGSTNVPAPQAGGHDVTRPEDRQAGSPAIFSEKKYRGRWAPRQDTTWWGLFGEVKLDLRDADWPADRLVLDFQSTFSEASIIVPPGTAVLDETTPVFGEVKISTSASVPRNGLTVVLQGILIFSDVRVKDA